VIAGGKTVVKDGNILGVDLPVLVEQFNQLVRKAFRES